MLVRNMRLYSMPFDKFNNRYPWGASVAWRYNWNSPLLSSGSTCRGRSENWFLLCTFFNTTIYFAFSEIPRKYLPWWKRFWVLRMKLITVMAAFLKYVTYVFEFVSFKKSFWIMMHGFCLPLLKSTGTSSCKRTCSFPAKCREGMVLLWL
jgi:hypothetical protein